MSPAALLWKEYREENLETKSLQSDSPDITCLPSEVCIESSYDYCHFTYKESEAQTELK